jgi:hypothetical protein
MRTTYTVWEWTQYNGWNLMLGTNVRQQADQVVSALKAYQPQNWYGVYGPYEVPARYELVATWQGRNYTWGWVAQGQVAPFVVFYAMAKRLLPAVRVGAKNLNGRSYIVAPGAYTGATLIGLPSWQVSELDTRYRAATIPGWAAQYAPQYA